MSVDKSLRKHCISIIDRTTCEISGVEEILCFDEYSICVLSSMGELEIEGEELKIGSFTSDTGLLSVSGKICGILYNEDFGKKHRSSKKGIR